jgi:hypothetical protein
MVQTLLSKTAGAEGKHIRMKAPGLISNCSQFDSSADGAHGRILFKELDQVRRIRLTSGISLMSFDGVFEP